MPDNGMVVDAEGTGPPAGTSRWGGGREPSFVFRARSVKFEVPIFFVGSFVSSVLASNSYTALLAVLAAWVFGFSPSIC